VQEYIKTTHPSSKLLEEVNSFKLELHSQSNKMGDAEARMGTLIDKRLANYTEIYTSMEKRFLDVIDVHHQKVTAQMQGYEGRQEEMQRIVTESAASAAASAAALATLESEVASQRASAENFISALDEMKVKLDSGITDFNANINNLVLELREKTWHAEQTCSRLAVDTLSRQNVFSKKMEAQIAAQTDVATTQFNTLQETLKEQMAHVEKRVEKHTKKNEVRTQSLTKIVTELAHDLESVTIA